MIKILEKSGDVGTDFGWVFFFWSADDFFVEAPKLKDSLTDPPIFRGFVVGEASAMVAPRFEEIYSLISAEGRPIIGRQSADYRQTVGRY